MTDFPAIQGFERASVPSTTRTALLAELEAVGYLMCEPMAQVDPDCLYKLYADWQGIPRSPNANEE